MTTPLRPMSTGEILDRTFNLYRNNFVLFAGIAVVPPALLLVVNLIGAGLASPASRTPAAAGVAVAGGLVAFVAAIAYFVGLAVAHAATIFAVSAVHLERTTSIGESYARVKGHYGRVLWAQIQAYLRAFWPLVVAAVVFGASVAAAVATRGKGGAGAAMVTGLVSLLFLAALVVGIVLYLRYALTVPACVLEDIRAGAAVKRSVALTAGCRGQIFVIFFLMAVIGYIVSLLFGIPAGLLARSIGSTSFLAHVFIQLATFFAGALAGPIATIALSLVYFDQRVRKEAFDLQLMMAAVDGTPPTAQAASAG